MSVGTVEIICALLKEEDLLQFWEVVRVLTLSKEDSTKTCEYAKEQENDPKGVFFT